MGLEDAGLNASLASETAHQRARRAARAAQHPNEAPIRRGVNGAKLVQLLPDACKIFGLDVEREVSARKLHVPFGERFGLGEKLGMKRLHPDRIRQQRLVDTSELSGVKRDAGGLLLQRGRRLDLGISTVEGVALPSPARLRASIDAIFERTRFSGLLGCNSIYHVIADRGNADNGSYRANARVNCSQATRYLD